MDHNRLKQLAGISETEDDDLDAEIAAWDARDAKLKAMNAKIRKSFAAVGLPVEPDDSAIDYDEDQKTVQVTLDFRSGGFMLSQLEKLQETGLAGDYHITAGDMTLVIGFDWTE